MRGVLLLFLASGLTICRGFTAKSHKYNTKLDDFKGKTAWIRDVSAEVVGSFSAVMCVDYESGELFEAVYDNPGMVRKNRFVSNSAGGSLVIPEIPYPGSIECAGNGIVFVAGSALNASVAAVKLTNSGQGLNMQSAVTPLPEACGGVLNMQYVKRLNLLVATCGKDPASAVVIEVDSSNPEKYVLVPGTVTVLDGPTGVVPRGLAVLDDGGSAFAYAGLSEGTVVKLSLPALEPVERRDIDAKRISDFSIGDNGKTLVMFSPYPWRRLVLMDISSGLGEVTSVALDQDMEFLTTVFAEPTTTTAYAIGNSQRGLPAVMQFDITKPFEQWGIILAGQCSTEQTCARRRRSSPSIAGTQERSWQSTGGDTASSSCQRRDMAGSDRRKGNDCDVVVWCEWGPKGRFARSATLDLHPDRPRQLYIGVAASYCEHCQEWEGDNAQFGVQQSKAKTVHRARCKEGKAEEDYYDNDSYCLQEAWNTRTMAWGGGLTVAEKDQLSGKNWGGENVSVAVMQLGSIPKIGGVAGAGRAAPSLWATAACALAAVAALLELGRS